MTIDFARTTIDSHFSIGEKLTKASEEGKTVGISVVKGFSGHKFYRVRNKGATIEMTKEEALYCLHMANPFAEKKDLKKMLAKISPKGVQSEGPFYGIGKVAKQFAKNRGSSSKEKPKQLFEMFGQRVDLLPLKEELEILAKNPNLSQKVNALLEEMGKIGTDKEISSKAEIIKKVMDPNFPVTMFAKDLNANLKFRKQLLNQINLSELPEGDPIRNSIQKALQEASENPVDNVAVEKGPGRTRYWVTIPEGTVKLSEKEVKKWIKKEILAKIQQHNTKKVTESAHSRRLENIGIINKKNIELDFSRDLKQKSELMNKLKEHIDERIDKFKENVLNNPDTEFYKIFNNSMIVRDPVKLKKIIETLTAFDTNLDCFPSKDFSSPELKELRDIQDLQKYFTKITFTEHNRSVEAALLSAVKKPVKNVVYIEDHLVVTVPEGTAEISGSNPKNLLRKNYWIEKYNSIPEDLWIHPEIDWEISYISSRMFRMKVHARIGRYFEKIETEICPGFKDEFLKELSAKPQYAALWQIGKKAQDSFTFLEKITAPGSKLLPLPLKEAGFSPNVTKAIIVLNALYQWRQPKFDRGGLNLDKFISSELSKKQ